jgi:hypothetical protein
MGTHDGVVIIPCRGFGDGLSVRHLDVGLADLGP